jgi:hypothetical protein
MLIIQYFHYAIPPFSVRPDRGHVQVDFTLVHVPAETHGDAAHALWKKNRR